MTTTAAPGLQFSGSAPLTTPAVPTTPAQLSAPMATSVTPSAPAQLPIQVSGQHRSFEDAEVVRTEVKISGSCVVDTFDKDVSLDDRLRVVGEFRVKEVRHYVDKDGSIVRQQVIAPLDVLALVPWNSSDPNDDGILRARP